MIELIDFYADWCGPCQAMKPIFEEVEQDYAGKVEFKRVDVEEDIAQAQQFGVLSIPTFVLLKDGNEVDRRTGAMPKDTLKSWIDSNL
ncbi:MAG: thioredoxin [Patescibacteria group bacterium]